MLVEVLGAGAGASTVPLVPFPTVPFPEDVLGALGLTPLGPSSVCKVLVEPTEPGVAVVIAEGDSPVLDTPPPLGVSSTSLGPFVLPLELLLVLPPVLGPLCPFQALLAIPPPLPPLL